MTDNEIKALSAQLLNMSEDYRLSWDNQSDLRKAAQALTDLSATIGHRDCQITALKQVEYHLRTENADLLARAEKAEAERDEARAEVDKLTARLAAERGVTLPSDFWQ